MGKALDQIYVDNLYAEISRLTRRAVEAETLLEFERNARVEESTTESEEVTEEQEVRETE